MAQTETQVDSARGAALKALALLRTHAALIGQGIFALQSALALENADGRHPLAARDVAPGESWAFRPSPGETVQVGEIGPETAANDGEQTRSANGVRQGAAPPGRRRKAKKARQAKRAGRPKNVKPANAATDGRRGKHDDEVRKLWMEELPNAAIAKRLGLTLSGVYGIAKRLDLPKRDRKGKLLAGAATARAAAPAPTDAAGGKALTAVELAKFLKEAGYVVSGPDERGRFTVDRRTGLDGIGLLEIANDWRRKNSLAGFILKRE